MRVFPFLFLTYVAFAWGSPSEDHGVLEYTAMSSTQDTERHVDLPFGLSSSLSVFSKRGVSGSTKIGDYFDLLYTVMVTIGPVKVPLIVATNNADLVVLSDDCTKCNSTNLALYPKADFVPIGGTIPTDPYPTEGPIGIDSAEIAGVAISDQCFVLVNSTDSTIGIVGSGVMGFGFPARSNMWWEMTKPNDSSRASKFATFGPLVVRMAMANVIKFPMFSLSLQRTSIDLTASNPGILSIGDFPAGVDNTSLTWTPLRLYNGILTGPLDPQDTDNPHNFPYFWEIFLEGVFFDGVMLPWSVYASSSDTSALIDSTSSQIQGPPDVVQRVRDLMNGDYFDCSKPHTLAFKIGGKLFPVDPRDFIAPVAANSTQNCQSKFIVNEEIPIYGQGTVEYLWVLGTPFLKGVFSSFYYGNLTHPWLDPPRVGLLSRVPGNAGDLLKEAVKKGIFPNTTEELSSDSISTSSLASPSSSTSATALGRPTGSSTRLSGWCGWWAINTVVVIHSMLYEVYNLF